MDNYPIRMPRERCKAISSMMWDTLWAHSETNRELIKAYERTIPGDPYVYVKVITIEKCLKFILGRVVD